MTDDANRSERSPFLHFITDQLDLSGLDARYTPDELEKLVLPLIRSDIQRETLRTLAALMQAQEAEHWKGRLSLLHREMRETLVDALTEMMRAKHPDRLSPDEWREVVTFLITAAWLVRQQIDSDDGHIPG